MQLPAISRDKSEGEAFKQSCLTRRGRNNVGFTENPNKSNRTEPTNARPESRRLTSLEANGSVADSGRRRCAVRRRRIHALRGGMRCKEGVRNAFHELDGDGVLNLVVRVDSRPAKQVIVGEGLEAGPLPDSNEPGQSVVPDPLTAPDSGDRPLAALAEVD